MAKYRYMSGGQVTLPLTLRLASGAGLGFGAQHSQTADSWFLGVPGLLIAMPSTPSDLIGLLKTAIRSDDPALVFEHKALYPAKEQVQDAEFLIPFGQASVVRPGSDLTLVTNQLARREAEAAAEEDLAARGVSVEIIDPRTLVPFDFDTIAASVRKTRWLLVVQEAAFPGSWGATLAAWVASNLFDSLACGPSVLGVPEVRPRSRQRWKANGCPAAAGSPITCSGWSASRPVTTCSRSAAAASSSRPRLAA